MQQIGETGGCDLFWRADGCQPSVDVKTGFDRLRKSTVPLSGIDLEVCGSLQQLSVFQRRAKRFEFGFWKNTVEDSQFIDQSPKRSGVAIV